MERKDIAIAASIPNILPSPYDRVTDITWRGNVTEGGPVVTYTGTSLDHIEQQIAADVPGFAWNTTWHATAFHRKTVWPDAYPPLGVHPVQDTPARCGMVVNHRPCDFQALRDGYEYLLHKAGSVFLDARSCQRVSCSWDSGIYFCNDRDRPVQVPVQHLGWYAYNITLGCGGQEGMGATGVAGQMFNEEEWNVFVGATSAGEDC